jgi:hypothetical protein
MAFLPGGPRFPVRPVGPAPVRPGIPPIGIQPIGPEPIRGSFKKGGKVKKTGNYKLHKGERVLTEKQAKSIRSKAKKILGGK